MSDVYSVVYSPEAMNDLREIYAYVAFDLQSPDAAEGQVNRLREEIRSLDFMPSRYAIVDWEPWMSMEMQNVAVPFCGLKKVFQYTQFHADLSIF
ncbi:MAG: type II toxin-antitoxin system RelE/ParE family toxin [Lachnospiraceae bacterium]|nr:type II toxin-antitoxin system RelE/ParE family toxin [Lachnospiraceae bacterium]